MHKNVTFHVLEKKGIMERATRNWCGELTNKSGTEYLN